MKANSENPSYVDKKTVKNAVAALRQNLKDYADKPRVNSKGKMQLFDEQDTFFITLALQKAPSFVSWKPYRMFVLFSTHVFLCFLMSFIYFCYCSLWCFCRCCLLFNTVLCLILFLI